MFWVYVHTHTHTEASKGGGWGEDSLPPLKVFITLSIVAIDKHLLNILNLFSSRSRLPLLINYQSLSLFQPLSITYNFL